ncbi:MAG TPA: fluoride efflux transporter CrcB [Frankiaceae bacterium]|nr:fluoride efflux transporter CrcB [Frankiaceae bacterium]
MIVTLLVGLAAGLGALCRYVLDQVVEHQHDSDFPYGTLVVNVTGSLLLGLITGLSIHHGLGNGTTEVWSAGFCGGYTTWSTFGYESLALAEGGDLLAASTNVVVSLALGLAAAAAGFGLALL